MAGKKKHCDRCREGYMAHVRKLGGSNPNVYVNVREMVFPCKVPTFTTNRFGFCVARLRNCETGVFEEMPIEEWRRRNERGEL